MSSPEGPRWIQATTEDWKAAQSLLASGFYHLCAFHAQQAAEKALKGFLRTFGQVAWGHSCLTLLTQINNSLSTSDVLSHLFDAARRLDGHYISSRYPDAYPSGVPADYYDEATAVQASDDAQAILDFVRNNAP